MRDGDGDDSDGAEEDGFVGANSNGPQVNSGVPALYMYQPDNGAMRTYGVIHSTAVVLLVVVVAAVVQM